MLILFGLAIWLGASFILGVIVGKALCWANGTERGTPPTLPPPRRRAF